MSKQMKRTLLLLQVRLYNLTADPSEIHNIADDHPTLVSSMIARLEELGATALPNDNPDQAS
jgi:hypothetical protein